MKRFLGLSMLVGSVVVSAPAFAGGVIATAAVRPAATGAVQCSISNGSSKPVEYTITIYGFDGVPILGPIAASLDAFRNTRWVGAPNDTQGSCVVEVTSGSKKALRVAALATSATNTIEYAVPGQ